QLVGERYFAQRNAPICVTLSEGRDSASAKRIEIGPIALRLGLSHNRQPANLWESAISRSEMRRSA
ncbi:MAG: hypothetical protein JJU22_15705, partial [Gammaproteobacteria bacterium]|nr:hypothetical protein [Gammaproteobacteria bacterium]